MAWKKIYCAQAFWRRGGRLICGETHQFLNEDRAREGARVLLGAADGVAVFSVEGHPDENLWGEPQMIAQMGDAPGINDAA